MASGSLPRLSLIRGPNPGHTFDLGPTVQVIGRDLSAAIVIDSPGVSRRHAQISPQGDAYVLQDLGSANGTFVNDRRLSAPHTLSPGDRIRLGQSVELVYEAPRHVPATMVEAGPPPGIEVTVGERPPQAAAPPAPPPRPPAAPPAEGQTVLGDFSDLMPVREPPQLLVEEAGGASQTVVLTKEAYTLGRADDNDIRIGSKIVSRHHARLERVDAGYRVSPLPDVANPMNFEGRPLTAPLRLRHGDLLRIGGLDPGTMVTLRYNSPATAAERLASVEVSFGERTLLAVGRDPGNDIRLDAPQVSRFHAQLERVGARYRVHDLHSANGTFVNDQRVEGQVWLKPNDQLRIGPYRFVMGEDRLAQYDESSGLRVDAIGLNKWVRKDLNILQNISLAFQPREFIVVVGQSGGGKSTLVDAIAGYRPATHGRVLVNDIDVYRNFDAIRNDIGFVPQRDIIHMELSVYQALDYAAQLRMPPDTSKAERHQRIMEVLDNLDLTQRKDVQISRLSGGQQKRVSIGVELLTKPGLFFLDEPTSGLDPGTETALMQLMRRLADQGRTIVLITHATKNVMLADKVIFLARGGHLAWFGPPDEALKYFDEYRSERDRRAGDMEFDQIYAILDDPGLGRPEDWTKRYQAHPAYQQYILQPLQAKGYLAAPGGAAAARPAVRPGPRRRQVSALRQFFILSARNLKILTRDRFSLALMLAVAPLVGMLDIILSFLLGRNPFSPGEKGNVANVMVSLFLLVFYGVSVGGLAQMREIVKEIDIYKRERLVNLKILPYVISKVWVAALLALYQAAAYTLIHYLAFDMPGGLIEFGLIYITMVMATMAGMMLGLFASAVAPNANAAPLIVILLVLPQVVLGGALIPLPGAGQFISALTSTRWGFENMMAITGVGSDVAADACWRLSEEERDDLSLAYRNQNCGCMGVNVFRADSCSFPGVGSNYDPAIDAPAPTSPPPLRPAPIEPAVPDPPQKPADESDTVAVAEYLQALEAYQNQVKAIQDQYKAELAAYEAEASVYQSQVIAYQTELANYDIARNSAIGKAEGLIEKILDDFSWTFVDKRSLSAYAFKVVAAWIAQGVIISVLFVAIVIFQMRKDAV